MAYLTIAGMLVLVLSPILVPVAITVAHTVIGWRQTRQSSAPDRATSHRPQPAVRRRAVTAA